MKKRLQILVLVLVFLTAVLALASCQYRPIQDITTTNTPTFEVVFKDGDGTILKTQTVELGQAATAPRDPVRAGFVFIGWDVDFSKIDCPTTVTAQYKRVWTVQFVDHNGDLLRSVSVIDGEAAPTPTSPYRDNYTFAGWDKDYSCVKSDMTIRATYVENEKYTVVFLDVNGKVLNTQEVYAGSNAIAPTAPSIAHFTFKGWDVSIDNITCDLTVRPVYEEYAKFTVVFFDHLGNELKREDVYEGEAATAPALSLGEHFNFKGWDEDFSCVNFHMEIRAIVEEDAKYTVTFVDSQGNTLHSEVVYVGEGATAPAAPFVDNYTFAGWDKDFSNVQDNITVAPVYTENAKYTVIFVDYNGVELKSETVYVGKDATAPADPFRDNYTFTGWDKEFSNVQGNLTVTAQYSENAKYTVVFVDYNGNVIDSQVVYVGKDATAPAAPSRENYDFAGWDKAFTNIQGELTVTATYTEHAKYTVEFVDFDGTVLSSQVVYVGKGATAPDVAQRENFDFIGWDKAFDNVQGNLTVNAVYQEHAKYTVNFIGFDGSVLSSQVIYVGKDATAPAAPEVENFTFMGWDKAFTNIQGDLTVNAIYKDNNLFMVIFKDANGNVLKTEEVRKGQSATAPEAPFVDNYTFAGWDKAFDDVQGDLTVTATYTENAKYTVEFVDFDGRVIDSQIVYVGKDATAPAAPSRDNYTFAGWDKAFVNVQGDLTVTATYTENAKYTVEFVDFDGRVIDSQVVYVGKDATAPAAPSRENYDFAGWDKAFTNIQGDLTVTATYTEHAKYTVTFVDYDGSVIDSQVVYVGKGAIAPAAPSRDNYTFAGWDKAFANVQGDLTVTATYNENAKYTVEFVDFDGRVLKSELVYVGKDATAPAAPSRDNYTFAGWDKAFTNIQGELTVTATYTENAKYTVTFVDYDGTVLGTQVVYVGKDATAPAQPTRDNYTFAGWDKAFTNIQGELTVTATYTENAKYTVIFMGKDGETLKTEVVYEGKAAIAPEAPSYPGFAFIGWDKAFDAVTGDLTVTAQYEQSFTVIFKDFDGSVLKEQKVKEGESASAPALPGRVGYIFTGWDKAFDSVQGDMVITAQYEILKYNVNFSVVGGNAPATQVVEHGGKVTAPADPVREGFDFVEWRLNGKKYDFSLPVTADMTLVAYFKSNGQVPAITNNTLKIDPAELELWVGVTLQLNIMPDGETANFMALTEAKFDFVSTDPEVVSIEDDGTFTAHALGSAKIYAVVTKGGTYVGSKGTYTATEGDIIGICYMTVVETDEYYQNFLDDPENQKITLGSTSESRIDKNEFLSYPSGDYGSANIALWYNGTEAVFTATVDDNPNVMGDWSKWAVFADEFGIPTTFITPSLSGYANEGSLWQVISSSEYAMVQSHGATHLGINQHHSTARIWNEFYYGRKNINQTGGNDSLIIGYANGTNYAPISSLFFIGGRGVAGHLNTVDKIDYNTLNSFSGFPSDIPGKLNTLLGENATNGWMSVHYHQMGNSADGIRAVYEQMYPYIEDGRLWAALFADASQYGQERDTATLTMLETGADLIRFTLTDQMNDILFYHPLSVRVKVDSTWTGARAYQNGQEVDVQIITKDGETYLMVDAVPDKGEVTVVRTEMNVMEQSENAIRFEATDNLSAAQTMTATFPTAWNYAYATQKGVQIPAYVKDGVLYVTFDVNGGQVSVVPLSNQYDSLTSYTMTMIYNGYVSPDPTKSITIANGQELAMFSSYVNAGNSLAGFTVELIADIDMTGIEYQGAGFNFTYKGSSGHYMVRPFSGVFEGNKHKIYNLNLNQLTIDAGIFGYIKDAVVRNLNVEGNVNGGERVGGIASYADNSIISQCRFTGNVIASVIHKNQATGRYVGGIVGMVRNGSLIEHCNFNGEVMSVPCESYDIEVYNIGGIVGSLGAGTVNNCSMNGSVTAGDNSKNLGGIVGTIEASGEAGLRIVSNCFANVNVQGSEQIGGLIGYVSCNSSGRSSNIYNCSVIGSVTGKDYVGGLLGYGGGLSAYMVNCFSGVTVNAPESAVYVGTVCGGYQADSYGLRINDNYYVGSLNPGMPISVKISGNGTFTSFDVADGAAALEGLNTKANATANYNAWRLVDGIPSACYEEIYTVTFLDKNGDVIALVSLPKGFAATAPNAPVFEGFEFTGWDKAFDNVTSDMTVTALYKEVRIFTVTFIGKDGVVLKTEKVNEGLAATAPTIPTIEGWRFDGWDKTFDVVNDHLTVTAKYVKTWTLTYLDQAGEVWKVEVYDEGTVPTLAIAPAVKGATFIAWNPASVGAVTEDVVLTPIYQTRPATSAADYTVMHWTFGGNAIYLSNFKSKVADAAAAANPDIIIITGLDSHTLRNPKTINFEGYTCWSYGAGSSNSPAAATEAVHRYVGSGVAVYYKTDLFSPAGEVGHAFPGGDRVSQITVFPLANNEGLIIPVVVSYMTSAANEAQRATWVSQLKETLGEGFDTAIIRLYVEGSNPPDASWSASFNQAADENGYSLVCDGGTNVKKTQGEHNSKTAHYVYMMTYGNGTPTVSLSDYASVGITEDSTVYPNNQSTNTAFYDVAYTAKLAIGPTGNPDEVPTSHTVIFMGKDGNILKVEVVDRGASATAPEAPAVPGYTFEGWDKAFDKVEADLTVNAIYTLNKYTVTFLGQNGALISTQEVEHGKSATAPTAPAIDGYRFQGWDKAFDNVTGDLTVNAVYVEAAVEKYTVTFIGHGGAVLKTEEVEQGQSATAPEAPAVNGYTFKGWDKAFDNVTADITVTAVYQINVYTVTFVGMNDTVISTVEVEHGQAATAPKAPAVEGYTFSGWDVAFEAVTDNLTVTAIYVAQEPPVPTKLDNYKVMSWTLGGNAVYLKGTYGTFDPSFEKAVFEADPDIILLNGMGASSYTDPNFAVDGYSRWAYGEFADFRYNGVGYAILYKTDKFTPAGDVSYQNDSSYNGRNTKSFVMFPLKDTEGNSIPVVTAFLGTNHTEAHREQLFSDIKAALGNDLAAAIIRIYVESTTERNEFISGEAFSFATDENGYSFKSFGGVDIKKDGEHTTGATNTFYYSCFLTYSKGDATVTDINVVGITEDVTAFPNKQSTNAGFYTKAFTCIYGIPVPDVSEPAPEKHIVTFVGMDGAVIDTQEVEHGQAATAPEAPAVEGYTFTGWDVAFDNVTGDLTVTAVYTENQPVTETHTVTFIGHGGAVLKTEEVEQGKSATAPEAPAVNGYTFKGWDKAFDNVTADITVTAVYQINVYTVTFVGMNDTVISTVEVEHGQGATAPEAPVVDGYRFIGWSVEFVAVTDNLTVYAEYEVVTGGDDEEYEGTAIRTQADLAALANAEAGVYTIIKDLALVDWTPVSLPAGVVLGGNGHTITGLTTALFSEVHGTVKNLKIADANIVGSTNAHKYGVLANKLFDGAVVSHVDVVNANLVAFYAGGIAAEAEGNIIIEYTTVSGTIKQASTAGSALVGGFIGRYLQPSTASIADCRIEHSTNNATVTVSSNSASAAGFIANYGQGVKNNTMHFSYCTNNGAITITGKSGNAGGIFGFGNRSGLVYMDHCTNNADISNAQGVAGGLISGLESGTSGAPVLAAISDCVNHGNITGASKVGGLIGNAGNTGSPSHEIVNSVNHGTVIGSGSDVGGIVGFTSQNNREVRIYGCTNHGNVQGADNVGGILGSFGGTSASPKMLVNANYGDVTATSGVAGGLIGKINTSTNYTITITSFLQTGTVTGKHAGALIGCGYAQQYVDIYPSKASYTISGQLYKDTCSTTTIKATACVLSGEVIGSELAGILVGSFYGNTAPVFTLKDVLCDAQVTEKGALNSNPAAFYQFLYVATAGDADLVGTENEGKTAYFGRNASAPSYMFAYECDLSNAVVHTLTFGEIVGGINASVNIEGSAAYVLNQAAIKLGDTYPTWKNGATYPELQQKTSKYTVTFVGMNGEILKTEEVEGGQAATAPEAPVVEGYTFQGWDVAFDNVTGDLTVTAVYTENQPVTETHTVTFIGHGGVTLKTEEVEEGKAATAPEAPAVEGYTFSGWDKAFDNVTGDLTVTATYIINKYTVTFVGMDGATIDTVEVEHGQGATAPEAPVVDGYTFQGWDVAFDNVTGDLTVTATYTINKYTVTFVGMNGTVISTVEVEHGQGATAPEAPAAPGYTFIGWDVAFEAVTDDLTVTAQYEAVGGEEGGDEVEGTPIESQEQLADLKNAAAGSIYYLANDLTLSDWKSITLPKDVTLNGNGKTITGLTTPLFSDVSGRVENLTIAGATISGGSSNTGVVAQKLVDGSAVLNVHVVNCTLTDCNNRVGGIAGLGNGNITIQDCTVSGNIIAAMGYAQVGGILGRYENTSAAAVCTINACTNDATISYTGTQVKAAGIIGDCPAGIVGNEIHITNCTNNGAVTVTGNNGNAAGILGLAEKCGSLNIENCINNADISSSANPAGGIISKLASTSGSTPVNPVIAYCVNRGSITSDATAGVGGIVGLSTQENGTVVFLGCSNYGAVTGKNDAGGMLGQYTGKNSTFTFQAVANYGNLTANKTNDGAAGGLIGWIISGSGDCTVNVNGFLQNGVLTGKQTSAAMIGKVNMKNAQLTVNATACVLSGAMAGSNTALVVGRNWSTPNPIVNLDQVLSNLNVNHYEYTKALDIRAIQGNINDSVDTEGTVGYILNQASQQFGVTWKNGENYPEIQLSAAK